MQRCAVTKLEGGLEGEMDRRAEGGRAAAAAGGQSACARRERIKNVTWIVEGEMSFQVYEICYY